MRAQQVAHREVVAKVQGPQLALEPADLDGGRAHRLRRRRPAGEQAVQLGLALDDPLAEPGGPGPQLLEQGLRPRPLRLRGEIE